jgi:hypothetical protein
MIRNHLSVALEQYPQPVRGAFSIIYASRCGVGLSAEFYATELSWNNGWTQSDFTMPTNSTLLIALGSGSSRVKAAFREWSSSDVAGTSRAVFSAFCDAIQTEHDTKSGGSPQLVGLYRSGAARTFGIIYQGARYYNGAPIIEVENLDAIEWRNTLFERCDGASLARQTQAQPQPRPRNPRS